VPDPNRVKRDGITVANFLREERGVINLVVHGQSMGGMVATHIAAHSKQGCQLLVCDRSFSSLDAAGSRLMGSWAGWGLRWVCMWTTDSVSDYIAASNCHKCVIQDPGDEIIANPASLKVRKLHRSS
jgi:pimeloyl-ACP methyl ester carboxylesterase